MSQLFRTILYQPILNLLILTYNFLPIKDIGIAIIILTVFIRVLLWPLSQKTIEAQKKIKELQPKVDEINKKYKNDIQQRQLEIWKLYKENKANPIGSCLPMLIQLPILIAVFQVFKDGLNPSALTNLYTFVARPDVINKFFLSISYFDLSAPNLVLAFLTAVVQFWQAKMLSITPLAVKTTDSKDENIQTAINKQMLYVLPIMTLLIGTGIPGMFKGLPSGLMLYWFISTLLMGLQQKLAFKKTSSSKLKP